MGKFVDLVGQKFGKLTVLSDCGINKHRQHIWLCKCDCGKTTIVSTHPLKIGHTKSCGNCNNVNDEIGKRYGRLTIKSFVGERNNKLIYKCMCDCGVEKEFQLGNLKNGHTTSCGCYAREQRSKRKIVHGLHDTKLYNIWGKIKERCLRPYNKQYKFYGAKGITICDEWKDDFKAFYDWSIANGYKEEKLANGYNKLTIDRIDGSKGYEPSNCRWITIQEQQNNRKDNKYCEYNGERLTLAQMARKYNVDYKSFWRLLRERGLSVDEAIRNAKKI